MNLIDLVYDGLCYADYNDEDCVNYHDAQDVIDKYIYSSAGIMLKIFNEFNAILTDVAVLYEDSDARYHAFGTVKILAEYVSKNAYKLNVSEETLLTDLDYIEYMVLKYILTYPTAYEQFSTLIGLINHISYYVYTATDEDGQEVIRCDYSVASEGGTITTNVTGARLTDPFLNFLWYYTYQIGGNNRFPVELSEREINIVFESIRQLEYVYWAAEKTYVISSNKK